MRDYFDFLMEQLLSCSEINNKNGIELPYIEKNQVKLEFRKILDKLVINIINIIQANLKMKYIYKLCWNWHV